MEKRMETSRLDYIGGRLSGSIPSFLANQRPGLGSSLGGAENGVG